MMTPATPAADKLSPSISHEKNAVITGHEHCTSATICDEVLTRAAFCSRYPPTVHPTARYTIMLHTLKSAPLKSHPPSKTGAQISAITAEAAVCKAVIVIGSIRFRLSSPNTSDPAISSADKRENISPAPNPERPPYPHKRYSPAITAIWIGICFLLYFLRNITGI